MVWLDRPLFLVFVFVVLAHNKKEHAKKKNKTHATAKRGERGGRERKNPKTKNQSKIEFTFTEQNTHTKYESHRTRNDPTIGLGLLLGTMGL